MVRLVAWVRWIVRGIARASDREDLAVYAIPLVVALLSQWDGYLQLWQGYRTYGALHPLRLIPFLLMGSGLWIVLASRRPPRSWDIWAHLHIIAAWAGLLVGGPILLIGISDGDTGVIYIYGALFAIFSLASFGLSFTTRALELSPQHKRLIMGPFTILSIWYATERLVGRTLYDEHHIALIAEPLANYDIYGLFIAGVEAGFVCALLFVPYLLWVIFPRFVVGVVESPGVWFRRYAAFVLSVLVGLTYLTVAAL